jgi:hypothetical protein
MEDAASRVGRHLKSFRSWRKEHEGNRAVLVQYCGPEMTGSIDIELDQIEAQIEGCVGEGFDVFWSEKGNIIFLCVIESWEKEIEWEKVYMKEDLIDVDGLLREAGFEP